MQADLEREGWIVLAPELWTAVPGILPQHVQILVDQREDLYVAFKVEGESDEVQMKVKGPDRVYGGEYDHSTKYFRAAPSGRKFQAILISFPLPYEGTRIRRLIIALYRRHLWFSCIVVRVAPTNTLMLRDSGSCENILRGFPRLDSSQAPMLVDLDS